MSEEQGHWKTIYVDYDYHQKIKRQLAAVLEWYAELGSWGPTMLPALEHILNPEGESKDE